MTPFQLLFIRAVIGLVFAVFITRVFHGEIYIPYVIGLAVILVGLAYFAEYLRNRKKP